MKKLRIGMVGSKFAADFHADSHARNPKAEIVAMAAIDNLEPYSQKWGIKETMTDYKELCKRSDIDVIDVCVPNFLHYEVVMEAAKNGKHVFCEKPLAITAENAREMVEFCRKQGVKLLYAEDWCFAPALLKAINLIGQGAIGQLLWVKAKEVHNGSHSPFAQQKKFCGGGSLMHLAIHPIGFVRFLFGEKVDRGHRLCLRRRGAELLPQDLHRRGLGRLHAQVRVRPLRFLRGQLHHGRRDG